jgi:site-specific recombinase XerD
VTTVMTRSASSKTPELAPYIYKYLYSLVFVSGVSPHTWRSYRLDLSQAFGHLPKVFPWPDDKAPGTAKLRRLNDENLLKICRQSQMNWSGLAPASRNRKAATLKSFLNWLHENSLIERELALQIHSPKVPQRLPHYISADEAMALISFSTRKLKESRTESDRLTSLRNRCLILLLYGGGLRLSEACGLEWKSVDFERRVLRIRGKGGKERLVAVPDLTLAAIKAAHSKNARYVFGDVALPTRLAYDIIRMSGTLAGLHQPLHPHALRHSFATHLLASGAGLRTLQELLGHQTLQATQRYTHLGLDGLARTMEEMHPLGKAQGRGKKTKVR